MTMLQRLRSAIGSMLRLCGSRLPRRPLQGTPRECVLFRPTTTEILENPPGRVVAVAADVPVILQATVRSHAVDPTVRRIPLHVIRSVFESGPAADAAWVFELKRFAQDEPVLIHIRPSWPLP